MREIKFKPMLIAALLALSGMGAGCDLGDIDLTQIGSEQVAEFIGGLDAEQVAAVATNLMANEAVQNAVNEMLADETLVAQLTNFWPTVAEQFRIPDGEDDEPAADGRTELPAIGKGATVTGYGPVNFAWNMDDETLEDGLAYMQSRNVRWFNWEFVGNADEDVLGTPEKLARAKSRFLDIQAQCKARGIWCAPILFNDNAGDGAYSNGGVKLEKRLAQGMELIDWIAENADPSVCSFTVVSEIQTSAGERLESYGLAKLGGAGFRLDYNGASRPSSKPAGYSGLRCWHVCDINAWPSPDTIWLNDCGASIRTANPEAGDAMRSMSADGTLYGAGNAAVIEAYKAKAVERGQFVFARYGFQDKAFDKVAIDALSMPFEQAPGTAATALDGTILPEQVQWLGTSYSKAKQTVELTDVSMEGDRLKFKASAVAWPAQGAKKCKAVGFLIRKINGKLVGGKVEWCVVERGWYDIATNTRKLSRLIRRSGYNGATVPANGETCWAGLGHPENGSEVSTLVPFVWKD